MMILSRHGLRLPRFLLLGSALVIALIFCEWIFLAQSDTVRSVPLRPAASDAAGPTIAPLARPPAADYVEITARPLFIPERQPQPPDQAPSGPPPTRPNVTLVGVAMSGGERYALIRHGNPPKLERLGEGQSIDGWQIAAIAADRVTLRSGTLTIDYPLGGLGTAGSAAAGSSRPAAPLNNSWGGSPDPDPQ